jgi:hypothetical protein
MNYFRPTGLFLLQPPTYRPTAPKNYPKTPTNRLQPPTYRPTARKHYIYIIEKIKIIDI